MKTPWLYEGDPALPLVVSYFTDGFYLRDAWELARSCQALRVPYEITPLGDRGGWRANTNAKPSFLLDAAKRYPGRDLLWLDADARVRRRPELLCADAVREFPIAWRTWHERPASGTVFLPALQGREGMLEVWCRTVDANPHATDQVCLGQALVKLGLKHYELPVSYCWIYDFEPTSGAKIYEPTPRASDPVVIEHLQASRWTRRHS